MNIVAACRGCGKQAEVDEAALCLTCRVPLALPRPAILLPSPEFPLDVYPDPMANHVGTVAKAGAFPLSFCATSPLPVAAVAIGERRDLIVNADSDWREPSILFVALVGGTGEAKSPVMKLMMSPLTHLDNEAHELYDIAMEAWTRTTETERKKMDMKQPRVHPWIRSDVTIERLTIDLKGTKSILAWYDELTEWVRSIKGQRYGTNASANRPKWLGLWAGSRLDRVRVGSGGEEIDIHIKNPRVSLFGGIQPMLLGELCDSSDGMEQRMLFAFSEEDRRKKREGAIEDRDWWSACVRSFARLPKRDVLLRPEALALVDEFKEEMFESRWDEDCIPKIIAHCHRLSLILGHMWMYYEGRDREIQAADTERAIRLSRWFYAQREQIAPQLTPGQMEGRITLLTLERLKDYLRRKRDDRDMVEWRLVLQAKLPGIVTTAHLSQAVATLEAMDLAQETVMGRKKMIRWTGGNT